MSNTMYHAICATFNFIPEPLYQLLQTVDCTEPIFICPNNEIWHEPAVHNTFDEQISNTVLITTSDGKIRSVEVNPSLETVEAFNEHTKIAEEAARESESESEAPIRKTHKSTSKAANKLPPRKPNAAKNQKRKSDKNDSDSDEMETKKNSGRLAKKRKTRDAAAKANAQILSKATPKSPSKKGSDSNGKTSKVSVAAATSASKKSTIETKEAKKSNEAVVIGEKKNKQKKNDLSKPNDQAKKGSKGNESSTSKAAASASATKKNTAKQAKLNEAEGGEKKKKAASKPKNKDASNSKIKAVEKAEGKEVAKPEAPQKVGDKVGGRKRSQSVATEDCSAASGSTSKKAKSTKKKKKKKNEDPNMPKRPLTVYMLYCMEARPAAKKANPTAKVPQIGAILGKSWKALPQKDKERLQANAQKLKDQYDLDKADYEKNNPPKDDNGDGDNDNDGDTPVSEGDADATEKNSTGNASSAKKKKKKKQQKDPNAPKRPLTSYMIYSSDVRHDIMKENPGAKVPEVGKITGQMYGKLSKERRQHYAQKAQELKDKYDVVKAEYAKKKKIAGDDASKDPQDKSEWY